MTPFSLDDSVGYTLAIVATLLKRELNQEFRLAGITVLAEQWALLARLEERGSLNQLELAQATSRDNASITRTLASLEQQHLIERQQSAQDRRHKHLVLTATGQALVPRMQQCAQRVLARATANISPAELALLNQTIRKMSENLQG